MSGGGILFLLIIIVASRLISADQQKKKQAAQKQAAQQQQQQQPRPRPRPQRPVDFRFPELDDTPTATRPPQARWAGDYAEGTGGGSLAGAATEGMGGGSLAGESGEGTSFGGSLSGGTSMRTEPVRARMRQSPQHVVKAVTESEHRHTESSLTGIAPDCEEDAQVKADNARTRADDAAYNLAEEAVRRQFAFDANSVVQGFLYGEILGKPKAMRSR